MSGKGCTCFCLLLATFSPLLTSPSLTGQGRLPHPAGTTAALCRSSQVCGVLYRSPWSRLQNCSVASDLCRMCRSRHWDTGPAPESLMPCPHHPPRTHTYAYLIALLLPIPPPSDHRPLVPRHLGRRLGRHRPLDPDLRLLLLPRQPRRPRLSEAHPQRESCCDNAAVQDLALTSSVLWSTAMRPGLGFRV